MAYGKYFQKLDRPSKLNLVKLRAISGVILETEGSVQKIQRRALFHLSIVKKGAPNLTSLYVHSLLKISNFQLD